MDWTEAPAFSDRQSYSQRGVADDDVEVLLLFCLMAKNVINALSLFTRELDTYQQ